jgi:hypothetical protein
MAPDIACTNAGPRPPESEEAAAHFMAEFQRALRDAIERQEAEEG